MFVLKKFMMEDDLLLGLIGINSESGKENDIGEFIFNRLKNKFIIKKQEVNKNFNLFAYVGEPKVIFSAHMDTVPGSLRINKDNEFIYGRGACDNKCQLAAIIISAEKAIEKGLTDFGLLFTVQEETDFAGAKKAANIIPDTVKLMIIGEPSDLKIIKGQKGLLTIKLKSYGKKAHGSTPDKGINAIENLMNSLVETKKINLPNNPDIGESTINLGMINGGNSPNVVPDYAEAIIEIRNTISAEKTIEILKSCIDKCEMEIINSYDPYINNNTEELANYLGLDTKTVPFFTEAYFFNKRTKVIVLGAGKEDDSHSENEKIKIKDFKKLIELYYKLIQYFNLKE